LGLPDGDGLNLLSEVRCRKSYSILVLTARDAVEDRVCGLNGADDYLVLRHDRASPAPRRCSAAEGALGTMLKAGNITFDTLAVMYASALRSWSWRGVNARSSNT
jgi:DNA-binding response OmpR family regulator